MEQPSDPGKEAWVWRLKKGLYGSAQAGRTWNEELNAHMESVGYPATEKDRAVYVKGSWDLDKFVDIGASKELDALAKSVDGKYANTGLGEVR